MRGEPQPEPRQTLFTEEEYGVLKELAMEAAFVEDEETGRSHFEGDTEYVILTNFRFMPNSLRLKAGTLTRIRLGNPSLVTHYFGGEEFFRYGAEIVNVADSDIPTTHYHVPVWSHGVRDLYLFIKEPGEYRLDCYVPIHRDQGMTGTIIVE
jgi:uncharacterized cupredoxin-like copper-binding protein